MLLTMRVNCDILIVSKERRTTMYKEIKTLNELGDKSLVKVVYPSGKTLIGNWYEDRIISAWNNRIKSGATFYAKVVYN